MVEATCDVFEDESDAFKSQSDGLYLKWLVLLEQSAKLRVSLKSTDLYLIEVEIYATSLAERLFGHLRVLKYSTGVQREQLSIVRIIRFVSSTLAINQ